MVDKTNSSRCQDCPFGRHVVTSISRVFKRQNVSLVATRDGRYGVFSHKRGGAFAARGGNPTFKWMFAGANKRPFKSWKGGRPFRSRNTSNTIILLFQSIKPITHKVCGCSDVQYSLQSDATALATNNRLGDSHSYNYSSVQCLQISNLPAAWRTLRRLYRREMATTVGCCCLS